MNKLWMLTALLPATLMLFAIIDITIAMKNKNVTESRLIELVSIETQQANIMPHLSWMEHCQLRLVCRLWNSIINESYQLSMNRMRNWRKLWYLSWKQMHRLDGFYMHRFDGFFRHSGDRDTMDSILLHLKQTAIKTNDSGDIRMIRYLLERHFDSLDPVRTIHAFVEVGRIIKVLNITDQRFQDLYVRSLNKCCAILHSSV